MADEVTQELTFTFQSQSDTDRKAVAKSAEKYAKSLGLKVQVIAEHGYYLSVLIFITKGSQKQNDVFNEWVERVHASLKGLTNA